MQRADPRVFKFYQSTAWKKCRNSYMSSKLYICERCTNPATICHHKIYITIDNIDDPTITLNHDNLECLCRDCHNKQHFKDDEEFIFDEDGNVVSLEKK